MEWLFVGLVLVLALVWIYVKQNRPPPTPLAERELPDPQDLLARRLTEAASEARQKGQYDVAQAMALKATWLNTRPLLGQDDPPAELDANEQTHLRLAGGLWEHYSQLISGDAQAFAGCEFRPQSSLPYPKEYLVLALDMLIDVGEGRIQSVHLNSQTVPSDVVLAMKEARARLDGFVAVSADDLPTDPAENAKYGAERGWRTSSA
jgi:hypothetical protein